MFAALGITEVIDPATPQDPAMRLVTAGHAVKARGLNGLGFVNQPRALVPHFLPPTPRARLLAPALQASQRHDATLGRALETLSASGGTALYRLMAAPAATRLGLAPPCPPLESTSFHVDGRSHSEQEPEAEVLPITRGDSRDHRPDLNQGMLEWRVEQQAGIPRLRPPRSGNRSDAREFGQVIKEPRAPLQTPYGLPALVAERA
jgi:transposase